MRFALLDRDTKLLLSVTFDGAWEPYIRAIAEQAGPLLDVIFCHTVGYEAHASDLGYDAFAGFVRSRQVEADFFFADAPGTTARDVHLLKAFHRQTTGGGPIDPDPASPAAAAAGAEDVARGLRAMHQLHDLDRYFPAAREKIFLRRTAKMILAPLLEPIALHLDRLNGHGYGQERVHLRPYVWVKDAPEVPRPAAADPDAPLPDLSEVQGNVVTPYAGMTHGATLLLRIEDPGRAKAFLRSLEITFEGDAACADRACNVALTEPGLRRLGATSEEMEALPREFVEGMAARAGWLGDLGPNHPSRWRLPVVGWPLGARREDVQVRMSSVDVVIQLHARVEGGAGARDHVLHEDHPLFATIRDRFGDPERTGCQLMVVEVQRHLERREAAGHAWGLEHFGYLDGVSQPRIDGPGPARDRVAPGELVLGHLDDRDGVAARVAVPWLRNGTFQAIRKLRQDVATFERLLEAHRRDVPDLAAQMMGRPRADEGDPLLAATSEAELAALLDFDYREGGAGADVPIDSHVRRANPRSGPDGAARVRAPGERAVPRIARRGMPWGAPRRAAEQACDDETDERGLFFSCFNASLADQFEVLQRWLSGANASGAVGLRSDPFLGLREPGYRKTFTARAVDGGEVHVELPATPLVSLMWGLYLFVPSRSALRELLARDHAAAAAADRASDADVHEGEAVIRRMQTLYAMERGRDPERAWLVMQQRWKVLVEDLSARETMRQVWAAIRARGGALETPYGVLVGSRALIGRIFADPRDYSVSEYWSRMRDSIGELYLGMDPDPQPMAEHANPIARVTHDRFRAAVDPGRHARESRIANAWIARIDEGEAYAHAYAVARQVLRRFVDAARHVEGARNLPTDATIVDVRDLVDHTVGLMCTRWFDLPDPEQRYMKAGVPAPAEAHNPDNFKSTARYIFSPNPTEFVRRDGRQKGTELLENARRFVEPFVASGASAAPDHGLLAELLARRAEIEAGGVRAEDFGDLCARVIVGTIHGFVGPVGGTTTSLLNEWIKARELWRQQQALFARHPDPAVALSWAEARSLFLDPVWEGMRIQPFPYVLHRTPVRDVVLRQRPRPRDRRPQDPAPLEWDLPVEAGARVVLGLVSGAHDATGGAGEDEGTMPVRDLIFGGAYRPDDEGGTARTTDAGGEPDAGPAGLHACPGRAIGIGAVIGVLTALLQSGNLRRLAPLKLELAPFSPLRGTLPPRPPSSSVHADRRRA